METASSAHQCQWLVEAVFEIASLRIEAKKNANRVVGVMYVPVLNELKSPVPVVDEGDVASLADDDVVEHLHADQLPDFAEAAGDLEILG